MTIWFTSDTHFNHQNILRYCNRPYASVEEMNFALVHNWQQTVKAGDDVYFLGDFCISREKYAREILDMLPGRKFLITGNHDNAKIKTAPNWAMVSPYHELQLPNLLLVLCHYPFAVWNRCHYGSINLHGHSHGTFKRLSSRQVDVGVDCWDYKPVSLADVLDKAAQPYFHEQLDHHKAGPRNAKIS